MTKVTRELAEAVLGSIAVLNSCEDVWVIKWKFLVRQDVSVIIQASRILWLFSWNFTVDVNTVKQRLPGTEWQTVGSPVYLVSPTSSFILHTPQFPPALMELRRGFTALTCLCFLQVAWNSEKSHLLAFASVATGVQGMSRHARLCL